MKVSEKKFKQVWKFIPNCVELIHADFNGAYYWAFKFNNQIYVRVSTYSNIGVYRDLNINTKDTFFIYNL